METQEMERVITLEDLWEIFIRHIVPIFLAAVLCMGLLMGYSRMFHKPKYKSTATLYVLRQEKTSDYVYTTSDFSLALNVVNDCAYMLCSHTVLDDVIDELKLDMSYNALYNSISTANPENTRVLEVSVETGDPEESKRIVDSVCRIAADKITAAMGLDQVNVYSSGTIPKAPSNSIGLTKYAIVGIAAAVAVYALYLVAFMLDDRIKTEEDIQKYLGLSVLGKIPNSNDTKQKGRYGKYGRYGRYSRYGQYGKYYQSAYQSSQKKGGKAK